MLKLNMRYSVMNTFAEVADVPI